jgi:hypothetical protein
MPAPPCGYLSAQGGDLWPCTCAGDGDLYCARGDGGGFGADDHVGRVSWGSHGLPGCPARWIPCLRAQPSGDCARTSVAKSAAWWPSTPSSTRWEAFARRTTARIPFTPADVSPKTALPGWRISRNPGKLRRRGQHITTGITAVQLGASTTTNAGGQFSLTFTCRAAGTLMYMTATSARLTPATCDSATICLF